MATVPCGVTGRLIGGAKSNALVCSEWEVFGLQEGMCVIQWSRACQGHLKSSQSPRQNRTLWPRIISYGNNCVVIDHSAWMPFIQLSSYWWYAPARVAFFLHFSMQLFLAGCSLKILDLFSDAGFDFDVRAQQYQSDMCSANQKQAVSHGWKAL